MQSTDERFIFHTKERDGSQLTDLAKRRINPNAADKPRHSDDLPGRQRFDKPASDTYPQH